MPDPNSGITEGGEFEAIERLARALDASGPRPKPGEVWIGDDTAVLDPPAGRMLFTTDLVVEGVHGELATMGPADFGWRAMVASLSDVAAMGGRPHHAVVGVCGPPDTDLDGLYEGIAEAAARFRCPVVGGDLSGGARLVVAVAMTGQVAGDPGPVLRSGARPGDELWVTGPLGASAAGLRLLQGAVDGPDPVDEPGPVSGPDRCALRWAHLRPVPRLAEGEVARRSGVRAMVDISDGLAGDLTRLADASKVGFSLDHVPVCDGATLDDALYGGEDYALVMAAEDPRVLAQGFATAGLQPPIRIGRCTADPAERTLHGRGLPAGGFEHRFTGPSAAPPTAPRQ